MKTERIKGETLRWKFDDGPLAGKTFEHTFEHDGRVSWRMVDSGAPAKPGKATTEAKYEVARLRDDVYVVSYLGSSGYTLTSVLDFTSGDVVAIASNEKDLVLQRGTFQPVKRAA